MVQEDKASGMSQVHWDGIVGDLWMPSKFLSKPPITNILGTISLPGQSLSGRSTCPALTASWTQRQHPAQPQLQRTAKPQNLQQAQRPDLALTESCPALRNALGSELLMPTCQDLSPLRADNHEGVFLAAIGGEETQIEASFCEAIRITKQQKSVSLAKRAEATYTEYRRQKASGSGGRGFRLPL